MLGKRPWPAEAIARLREGWESGKSATRIGEEIGFSRNAVKNKAARLGLPARPERCAPVRTKQNDRNWPPAVIARLHELWSANVSATRIGEELGFTKSAIIGKARREGLPPRDTRFAAEIAIKVETEEDRETIRRMWMTHSVAQIKATTKIGWRRVIKIAESLGLPSRADMIIEKNKASPPRGARVSGAPRKRTPQVRRAARTSAATSPAHGGRVSFPPPGLNLPGVAPLEALKQRRVFSNRECKMIVSGDGEAVRFCDQPPIASAKGPNCASPYCLEHYAAFYIGTNKDMGDPAPARWL